MEKMITRARFMMDRDVQYPTTEEMEVNAARVLFRVNRLLAFIGEASVVSSGYRPGHFNNGYSKKSAHLTCEAIDLEDKDNRIKNKLNEKVLIQFDLYMEHPTATPTWCHLTTRAPGSGNRIFHP